MALMQRQLRDTIRFRIAVTALVMVQSGFAAVGIFAQQLRDAAPPPQASPMMDAGLPPAPVALHEHAATASPLPDDVRYLMVLERFTYGPRPGDLDKVRHQGLQAWFQQQMNPAQIDDHALDAKLANYPAMQMPLSRLMELYPTNEQIRQAVNRGTSIPGGDAARAIYADQEAQYKTKRAAKDGATKLSQAADLPMSADEILALPPDKRFKELCRLTLPQLRNLRQSLTPDHRPQLTAGMTPQEMEAIAAFNNPSAVVQAEDVQVKLLRDVYTERQLQEVMVDFWLNHFNVYIKKSQQAPYYIAAYERSSIRPYALGHFQDLLLATATSPAMLNYLDNSSSVGPHSVYATGAPQFGNAFGRGLNAGANFRPKPKDVGLNENYAREVMELHTIGVNGGYTQKDVTELAKVFTGWTVGKGYGMDVPAVAQYDPSKHEPGTKIVLGNKIKENGQMEGIEVLKALAASPQCAHFISTKLAVRFVSDTPPPAMIQRMEHTYLETHGDIRQVLISMVNSPEFFSAATYRAKLKTPQEFVISAVRATGADVDSTAGMQAAIAELGMPVYGMLTPNGYSMTADAWNNTSQLVSRMNFSMALATNRVPGIQADASALLGHDQENLTPEQKTARFEAILLHGAVSEKTQSLILGELHGDAAQQQAELRQVVGTGDANDPLHPGQARKPGASGATHDPQAALAEGLILGSPEFQRK